MDIQTRRRVLCVVALVAATASAAIVVRRRGVRSQRWVSWVALCNFVEAFKQISDVTLDISRGAREYICGETRDIPPSLERSLTLVSSEPVSQVISSLVAKLSTQSSGPSIVDTLVNASLSDRGQNLLALVASVSTTRAMAMLSSILQEHSKAAQSGPNAFDRALLWLESPSAHSFVSRCLAVFVSSGVTTFCDVTTGVNTYDEMLQAASKPEHLHALRSLTSTFCQSTVRAIAQNLSHDAAASTVALKPQQENGTSGSMKRRAASKGNSLHSMPSIGGPGASHSFHVQAGQAIVMACASADVRRVCVESAREGCAGAVQAAFQHLGDSTFVKRVTTPTFQNAAVAGLMLWLLLLPIVLLYLLSSAAIAP
jgi:hypothetical protein